MYGDISMEKYEQYIHAILLSESISCEAIKLSCKRFQSFQQNPNYYFDVEAVNRVIRFILLIRHYLGKHNGKPFKLEGWQTFIISAVYGFKYKSNHKRVCRNVFILMARKNGKSALCAALSLFHLIADGESAAEIFFSANSREQAKILLNITSNFAKSLDKKNKKLITFRDTIKYKNNFCKVVSSDTSKLDGYNLSFAVLDEYHEAKDTKMYDIISSSMAMREQPLLISISTAGFNQFGICKQQYDTAKEVLNGVKQDDSMQAFIFELDANDKWDDPVNFQKSNPNLGITVTTDFITSQILKAKNTPSLEVSVKTKNLNMWVNKGTETWIDNGIILKATKKLNINDFKNKTAYFGVDLASVSDLTAVSCMIIDNNKYYFFTWYYLPQSALSDNSNAELYIQWKQKKLITITEGNCTDYDYITNDLMKLSAIVQINSIAYDSYNATQWAIDATAKGLPLTPFSQSLWNFNKPTKEFERLALSNQVVIDDNEITRYCFSNVSLKSDHNDNTKPVKVVRQQKIDGVISMLESLGGYLNSPQYSNEIFTI
ncbi:hypothetical protein EZS27_018243 [termite gut metagenome]|uniref:Terminase large subunit n=1 Tax=termite gut metagenome TaxID=433724 RepID=A0A5J4RJK3_9ZZZZ